MARLCDYCCDAVIYIKTDKMILNKIIKFLTLSDFAILTGFSFLAPIFAVFIVGNIEGATMETAGFATSIQIFSKALLEYPIARMLDKKRGDMDEFYCMVIGSFLICIVPLLYLVIRTADQLYLVQFIYGIATAMAYPAWMSLFTRHAEKEREGSQWAFYATAIGIGTAVSAAMGGVIGERYGFAVVFWIVFAMSVLGSASLIGVYEPLRVRHEHHKIKQEEAFEIKEAGRRELD